jgi:hypothetical protein
MLLGFSTGCLYKTHEPIARETFAVFRGLGCNAIELTCNDDEAIIKLLAEIRPKDLDGFTYVSLHAPAIHNKYTLDLLQRAQDIFQFKTIVVHPDEVDSLNVFLGSKLPLAIENMDWRKDIGKYVESMQDIFKKSDFPMALDLNHCFTNDPSMRLAAEMHAAFGQRIVELHLSGFDHLHEPLFRTKQTEILEAIPDKNLPIIIESGCESVEDAKKEFEYVKNFLEKGLTKPKSMGL